MQAPVAIAMRLPVVIAMHLPVVVAMHGCNAMYQEQSLTECKLE